MKRSITKTYVRDRNEDCDACGKGNEKKDLRRFTPLSRRYPYYSILCVNCSWRAHRMLYDIHIRILK